MSVKQYDIRDVKFVVVRDLSPLQKQQLKKLWEIHIALPSAPWHVEAGEGGEATVELSDVQLIAQLRNLLAEMFDGETDRGAQ